MEKKKFKKKKRKFVQPSVFLILIGLIFLVIIGSWIAYWATGSNPNGQIHPAGILEIFSLPIKGFINSAEIIVFLIFLSSFLLIVNSSKTLDAAFGAIFLKLKGKEVWLIVVLMVIFSICGTTFGFCEAAIPFYALLIPVLLAAGFDRITAFLVICFGAGIGVLASTINPVLIQTSFDTVNNTLASCFGDAGTINAIGFDITQNALSSSTGLLWRFFSYIVLLSATVGYTVWYGLRVKKDPSKSLLYVQGKDKANESFKFDTAHIPPMTGRRKATLAVFVITFIVLIVFSIPWDTVTNQNLFEILGQRLAGAFPYIAGQGVDANGNLVSNFADIGKWKTVEVAFLFFIASFIAAIINWKSEGDFVNSLVKGAADFLPVIFIIAIATAFGIIMAETGINNVIVGAIGSIQSSLPPLVFVIVLFFIFMAIAFCIPSMSGFAKAVYPTMAPALTGIPSTGALSGSLTSTLINGAANGVSISGSILGFSFASGIINLLSPTAAPFMIGLQSSKISLGQFYKATWPLIAIIFALMLILLLGGTGINMVNPNGGIF